MANPSKQKGTAAETATVNYCRANGFPDAARLTLTGRHDKGDIVLVGTSARPRVILEVKAHKAFSDGDVMMWLGETERERINAGAERGVLVVKRPAKGTAQISHWWAVELVYLGHGEPRPMYMYLGDKLEVLKVAYPL